MPRSTTPRYVRAHGMVMFTTAGPSALRGSFDGTLAAGRTMPSEKPHLDRLLVQVAPLPC